jgi:predicted transcriptional regulator/FixJ family two-component response regulator
MDDRELVKLVRIFASSELRMNTLLSLKNDSKDINDLQEDLGGRNTTILHALRDMVDLGLIEKDRDGYRLTNLGKIKTGLLSEILRVFDNLETNPGYWQNHDIRSIPPVLLERLSMLFQSDMISPDPTEPLRCHEMLVSMLAASKNIRVILPVLIFPKGSDIFLTSLRRGSSLDILVTEDVTPFLLTDDGVLEPEIKKSLKFESFSLRLAREEIRLALVVTESFVYLGLFLSDGVYDLGSGAIYTGECAVTWGTKLFEYYAGRSTPLDEEELLRTASSSRSHIASVGGEAPASDGAELILLVEDDVGHAALIRRIFEDSGSRAEFHHQANLRDALRWVKENRGRSFLVIADYLLPDGCGIDLSGNADRPLDVGFPLIILTGYGSEKIAVQAFKSGAMDYVVKDAESLERLPEIVRDALRKWRLYQRRAAAEDDMERLGDERSRPLKI